MRIFVLFFVSVSLAACATSGQKNLIDFNTQFNEDVPANPEYKIERIGVNRYQIVVYQGSILISEVTTRVQHLTKAAFISMETKCIEQDRLLGEYDLKNQVDSLGYVNVLGFFNCKPQSNEPPNKPSKTRERNRI